MRRLLVGLLLAAIGFTISACAPREAPRADDLVGTWVASVPGHKSRLVLGGDQSFTMDEIPLAVLTHAGDQEAVLESIEGWADVLSVDGSWYMVGRSLHLSFEVDGQLWDSNLTVLGNGAQLELVRYLGDPDEGQALRWKKQP